MDVEKIRQAAKKGDKRLLRLLKEYENPIHHFVPRPDDIDNFDQQSSFVHDRFNGLAVALGGTGSGKSLAASWKF